MVRIPASRTVVPPLPAWSVPRPALRARLAAAAAGQLIVVIAPAGSGKTVLLAEWARHDQEQHQQTATAWVGLDRDDADPDRFWAAVLAAVLAADVVPADDPLHGLRGRAAAGDDIADALLDGLDDLPVPLRLVLDDAHVLSHRRSGSRALARLVRHRPAGVRLVLAARSDPAVGLPRLRLSDGLCELRVRDLRFTVDEAAALAASCGVPLTGDEVAVLHRRTEGWAAGLRLAVLALRRDREEPGAFLARFSGDERSVADYLGGEILAGLTPDDRALLGDLAVCGRLPDPLAVTLSGHPDAARRLEELTHGLGMVDRVDPGTHRLHTLVRSHLDADLARRRPDRHRRQHAVAARWWAEHAEPAHALRHAERADDPALTADLLRRVAVPLLARGELPALRRALAGLDTPTRRDDPHLALIAALVHLADREPASAAALLRSARAAVPARPAPPAPPGPGLAALRATAELFASAAGAGPRPSAGATGVAVPDDPASAGLLHLARGTSLLATAGAGDTDAARAELRRALAAARAGGFARLEADAYAGLALTAVVDGDPRGVTGPAEAALRADRHATPVRTAGTAAVLAWADLLRGDPARAAARCAELLEESVRLAAADAYALRAVHGAAVGDLGRRGAGAAATRAAREALGDTALPAAVAAALALLEHRAALLLGNVRAAHAVTTWLVARTGETDEVRLMRAWVEAATGRWEAARTAVGPLLGRDRPPGTLRVEAHLLAAETALRGEDTARARSALDAALAAGRAHDLVRPFALAGVRARALLGERTPVAGFDARVAAVCRGAAPEAAPPLSERELVVLALLPSLLAAPAMAEELVVSVNTVKTQIRSIYAKLGVSTRRHAVTRARERGLLV
ncbi:LuxR family transcriptional regulator [Actinomycetospora cinnamomea]|uniref:LuxR family maltose regulon positive regulatory protein n=1 Tax=Actinomycetospora cinnamomea TaxID=663609 RepID=A0A2U1EZS8_9PSEU|nr:LuxR family transcriptional regulator [Actinomycetospora cinnamomea]PVZ05399.1 LuxR family maltose regulon positive regulatory protein [Actinomycetospora cinnamomea]